MVAVVPFLMLTTAGGVITDPVAPSTLAFGLVSFFCPFNFGSSFGTKSGFRTGVIGDDGGEEDERDGDGEDLDVEDIGFN